MSNVGHVVDSNLKSFRGTCVKGVFVKICFQFCITTTSLQTVPGDVCQLAGNSAATNMDDSETFGAYYFCLGEKSFDENLICYLESILLIDNICRISQMHQSGSTLNCHRIKRVGNRLASMIIHLGNAFVLSRSLLWRILEKRAGGKSITNPLYSVTI